MAASGARVLQLRSVEFARSHDVKLHVRSSFTEAEGTWIREEDERMLEKALISGVTHSATETVYRVEGVDARRGSSGARRRPASTSTRSSRPATRSSSRRRETASETERRPRRARGHVVEPRRPRQGERHRRGDEEPSRDRRPDVRDARGARHRAGARVHLADQDRVLRRRRTTSSAPSGRCTKRSSSTARGGARPCLSRGSASSARPARSARSLSAARRARLRRRARVRLARARPARRCLRRPGADRRGGDARGARAPATSTCASSRSGRGRAASSSRTPSRRRGLRRQVGGLPAHRRRPARRPRGERRDARPSTTGSSRTRTARRSSSSACSSRCTKRQGCAACGSRPTSRRRAPAPAGWSALRATATRWKPTSPWTGTFEGDEFEEESKLRAETRKILELPDLPIQRDVRPGAGAGRPLAGGLDRDRAAALAGGGERAARRRAAVRRDRVPDRAKDAAGQRRRPRRADPAATRPTSGLALWIVVRQPPQGRGAERDPDRRAPARAAGARRLASRLRFNSRR